MSRLSFRGDVANLLAGLLLLGAPLVAKAQLITSSDVKKSLEVNDAAWRAKINAQGRPRLFFDKAGLAALKARLMKNPRSPEVKALLDKAYALAPKLPRPYVSPADNVKTGVSPDVAVGETWIRPIGDEITMLAVAAALDPSPILKKALHDAVIGICTYPTWGSNHGEFNIDLPCSHAARAVAIAWDWFPELWSSKDRDLILQTITHRVSQLQMGLHGKVSWAQAYANNHNHVCCCGLAWCGLAFYTDIPQAPEWLAAARLDFQKVACSMPEDGSSFEGVPYWSYGISFILEYIEGTRGVIDSADLYQSPFLKNAVNYRLNVSTCGLGATLPWGDAPSRDYAGPQYILNRLAGEYKNPMGTWLSHKIPWPPAGAFDTLAWMALWSSDVGSQPQLPLDYHHWVTDLVTTRSGWGLGDYLLAIKSGFTNRNHCHLDAGALAFAFGSDWLLTAPGYGKGGQGTHDFWETTGPRWKYYSNATESHCTLLINGQNQRFDPEARGTIDQFFSMPNGSWTGINLTEAYKDVSRVRREVLHRRGEYILVFDAVDSQPNTKVEWLAQFPCEPEQSENALTVKAESGQLRLEMLSPAAKFFPRQPTSAIVDPPLPPHTYAAQSSGATVHFMTLLQPGFSTESLPALKANVVEEKLGFAHLALQGSGWTDDIFKSDEAVPVNLAAPDQGVHAVAKVTVIRTEASGVTSCAALDATALNLPGIQIKLTRPAKISLQKMPNGSWILDADQDIEGQITVAQEFTVQPIEKNKNSCRYLLSKEGTTLQQASEWLNSLVLFREKAPLPVRAQASQPPLPASVVIPIGVENFTRESQGEVVVEEGRQGAIGKTLRGFGRESAEHYVCWKFEVPQAGQYSLTLRYASSLPEVFVGVLVDGTAPCEDLRRFAIPATGGWAWSPKDKTDWKNLEIKDSHGAPVIFNLTPGVHELRLTRPTGLLMLNRFEFKGAGKP